MAADGHSEDSSPLSDAIVELIAAYVEQPEAAHSEAVSRVLAAFPERRGEVRARLRALRTLSRGLPGRPGRNSK